MHTYLKTAATLARDLSDRTLWVMLEVQPEGVAVSGEGRHSKTGEHLHLILIVGWPDLSGAQSDPLTPTVRKVFDQLAVETGQAKRTAYQDFTQALLHQIAEDGKLPYEDLVKTFPGARGSPTT